ncbi:MAG: phage integrase SAM-like domain and Arm DNA-binding domain-containing protein [Crocinitomicaceae bacterium]
MKKPKIFDLAYYLNTSKIDKNGMCPIMLRVSYKGKRVTIGTKRKILPENWSNQFDLPIPGSPGFKELNLFLESLKLEAGNLYRQLCQDGLEFDLEKFKNKLTGKEEEQAITRYGLCDLWEKHNSKLYEASAQKGNFSNHQKYSVVLKYFRDFLKSTKNQTELPIDLLTREVVLEFFHFLKVKKGIQNNTAIKYMQKLRTIVRESFLNGLLAKDPFVQIRFKFEQIERSYLTDEENYNELPARSLIFKG